jgi:hypothetical protein
MYTEIKTFEDACKALNYDASAISITGIHAKHQKAIEAHAKLIIIAEAINEGWRPDWNNSNEYKYQLWPDIEEDETKPSGFGLSYGGCDHWGTDASVGSRLCFQSREKARYCFDTFIDLWEAYFLIDKAV